MSTLNIRMKDKKSAEKMKKHLEKEHPSTRGKMSVHSEAVRRRHSSSRRSF